MVSTPHHYLKTLSWDSFWEWSTTFQGQGWWVRSLPLPGSSSWFTWRSRPLPQHLPVRWAYHFSPDADNGTKEVKRVDQQPTLVGGSQGKEPGVLAEKQLSTLLTSLDDPYGLPPYGSNGFSWSGLTLPYVNSRVITMEAPECSAEAFAPCGFHMPGPCLNRTEVKLLILSQWHMTYSPLLAPFPDQRIHGCLFQDTGCSSLLTSPGFRSHGPSSLLCSYKVVPVVCVYLWSLYWWQGYSGFLINCCETTLQDRFCICPEISLIILHTLLLGLLVRETHLNLNLSWGQGWKPNWKQSPACHYGANTTLFLFLDEDFGVRIGRGLVRTGGSGSLCHAWTGHLSLLVPQKWPWPWANVTLI